jgi:oligopeptide/dipeptide ABC transporter ATP-binding protein
MTENNVKPVLELVDVSRHFKTRRGMVRAVDDVTLSLRPGEILGLVGESGSGKTTLGRIAVALDKPTKGSVIIDGSDVAALKSADLRASRKRFNMVFQDPTSSINPRLLVGQVVSEVLRNHKMVPKKEIGSTVADALVRVGLDPEVATRYIHALSGGQRQRVSLARALISYPSLLVADEPTSALDVSVQASILNLIADLQRDMSFACLFISHNLTAVEYVADRVAVMYLGQVVEVAKRTSLFKVPLHPYSEVLLDAAPIPEPERQRSRERLIIGGDIPSPLNVPPGCRFHTRCPLVTDRCRTEVPQLKPAKGVDGSEVLVACHLVEEDGTRPELPR